MKKAPGLRALKKFFDCCLKEFTVATSHKHKPMWNPASLRNPPASASRGTPLWQGGALVCAPISAAVTTPAARWGSLAKESWHAGGVTEGFHSRHFLREQAYVGT